MVELSKHIYIEQSCEHCMFVKYFNLWTKCGICSQLEAVGSLGDFFYRVWFVCLFFPSLVNALASYHAVCSPKLSFQKILVKASNKPKLLPNLIWNSVYTVQYALKGEGRMKCFLPSNNLLMCVLGQNSLHLGPFHLLR